MNSSNGTQNTRLLSRGDISDLISLGECIRVVEEAFRMYSEGGSLKPEMMHVDSIDGEFHVKGGGLKLQERLFGLKINGDFPLNLGRFGMPNLQGVIVLCSGENGYPLAIMDSREITLKRTGAATAVAARYLANPNSDTVTICGCGVQGRMQLRALAQVLPIRRVFAFSRNQNRARAFAAEMFDELGILIETVGNLRQALQDSNVCVTCTRSTHYFLPKEYVTAGTFIAAVGADTPAKQELDPELLMSNKVVVDIRAQCAKVGELHHALVRGFSESNVHAELGEVVSGKKPGRCSREEIIIFDSTGTALQDVAAAAAVYEKALRAGTGTTFDFFT
jgi:alanine dehydrogenase